MDRPQALVQGRELRTGNGQSDVRQRVGRARDARHVHAPELLVARRRRRGQSLTEFALALPVFLLLTLGVIDMARVYAAHITLTDAVRKAALYAAEWDGDTTSHSTYWCSAAPGPGTVACPTSDINGNAVSSSGNTHDPDNIAAEVQSTGLDAARITLRAPGCYDDGPNPPVYYATPCLEDARVVVAASYMENLLTPILSNILGGQVQVSASTSARVLRAANQ